MAVRLRRRPSPLLQIDRNSPISSDHPRAQILVTLAGLRPSNAAYLLIYLLIRPRGVERATRQAR